LGGGKRDKINSLSIRHLRTSLGLDLRRAADVNIFVPLRMLRYLPWPDAEPLRQEHRLEPRRDDPIFKLVALPLGEQIAAQRLD
jgi:hypothetical protein